MRQLIKLYIIILVSAFFVNGVCAESSHDLYNVGVNDVLLISVLEHPELTTNIAVSSDGTITFPYIGIVHVKGKKLSEIQDDIKKRLGEGYINYPVVTVSLVKSMSRKIFTYGELNQRGVLAFEDNMTLLNALSLAGGVSQDGKYGKLIVKRKKEGKAGYDDIVETYLNNGFIENKKISDMNIKLDDILLVERSNTFLMQGEVVSPGRFALEKDMTVLRALLQAGGVSRDGLYGTVKVRRKMGKNSNEYKDIVTSRLYEGVIESSEVENTVLRPDDILIVERNKTFLIQGEVANRGRFTLEKDMTVLNALLQAGGASPEGIYGYVKVRRKKEGHSDEYIDFVESSLYEGVIESSEVENTVLHPDDILIVERNKTFLIQGEVANRGRLVFEKNMTVLRALLQAGGVSPDGLHGKIKVRRQLDANKGIYEDVAESKINKGIIESKEVENTLLQPDDILVVERNDTYLIYGEINLPGEYVLKTDITLFNAITIAGGFTKWGSQKDVKIIRSTGDLTGSEIIKINLKDVIEGNTNADIFLKSGDRIIVSTGIL